jgi:hypothetical protein
MQFVGMQFDTTLCGDWAGNAFPGGMDKCNAAVEDPDNFARAFLSLLLSVVWCGADHAPQSPNGSSTTSLYTNHDSSRRMDGCIKQLERPTIVFLHRTLVLYPVAAPPRCGPAHPYLLYVYVSTHHPARRAIPRIPLSLIIILLLDACTTPFLWANYLHLRAYGWTGDYLLLYFYTYLLTWRHTRPLLRTAGIDFLKCGSSRCFRIPRLQPGLVPGCNQVRMRSRTPTPPRPNNRRTGFRHSSQKKSDAARHGVAILFDADGLVHTWYTPPRWSPPRRRRPQRPSPGPPPLSRSTPTGPSAPRRQVRFRVE